jgi:hypothetical protein
MLEVDCVGKSGGLALLWKEDMEVEIQNFSQRYISTIVKPINGPVWKFTDTQKHISGLSHGVYYVF